MDPIDNATKKPRYSTSTELPDIQKHRGKLNSHQIEVVQNHYKSKTTIPSRLEIQSFIRESFGVEYSLRTIYENRRKWGILTYKPPSASRSLNDNEIEKLKEFMHTFAAPPNWKKVQSFIKDSFHVHFSFTNIRDNQSQWGIAIDSSRGKPPKKIKANEKSIQDAGAQATDAEQAPFEFDSMTKEDINMFTSYLEEKGYLDKSSEASKGL